MSYETTEQRNYAQTNLFDSGINKIIKYIFFERIEFFNSKIFISALKFMEVLFKGNTEIKFKLYLLLT